MEFEWKQENEITFNLYGYETILIATLKWNEDAEVWEIQSKWLDYSDDLLDDDFVLEDVEKAKLSAIEQLISACKDHIDWYRGQINMLDELYQDMNLN